MKARHDPQLEEEANLFAMLLLMPKVLLERELLNIKLDLGSDNGYKELAKKFDVPVNAMITRIEILKTHKI